MDGPNAHAPVGHEQRRAASVSQYAVRAIWHTLRVPILATLTILEPIVRTLLSGLALLGILMALFFKFLVKLPDFPFWLVLGISVGCALSLTLYYLVMRVFSRR